MMDVLKWILCAVVGYLLGNFATGITVGKVFGIDIRETGSKNAGTTNVLRTLGWMPSLLTFLGDALKGVIAALIGKWLMGGNIYGAYVAGIAVILGHNWPVFYHFRGGKGIATSFGVILAVHPLIALGLLLWQIVVVAITKYMSVASITGAVVFFVAVLVRCWGDWLQIVMALIVSILAIFSHRANIGRLMRHEENRLDFSKINKLSKKK